MNIFLSGWIGSNDYTTGHTLLARDSNIINFEVGETGGMAGLYLEKFYWEWQ